MNQMHLNTVYNMSIQPDKVQIFVYPRKTPTLSSTLVIPTGLL